MRKLCPLIIILSLIEISSVFADPLINTIKPKIISLGETLTITGSGFANQNSVHIGSETINDVNLSSQAALTCVNNPKCDHKIFQTIKVNIPHNLKAGNYKIYVSNEKGKSNTVNLVVK